MRALLRWGVKSVGGLGVNLLLLTVWVDVLGIAPELAIGINWLLIAVAGYVVTDRWVFQNSASPTGLRAHLTQLLGMQGVMASSKLVNYVIYVGLIQVGADYRIAWVIGAVVVFLGTYTANKRWWERRSAVD